MACIGGILLWVASNMIKPAEIKEVKLAGRFEMAMLVYTAVMVPLTDFMTGVLSAMVLYFVAVKFFPKWAGKTSEASLQPIQVKIQEDPVKTI
jgi:SulP family sulfate permease